ncbi:MAG: permease [Deltaproteobacteria bacterium]|nr:permease [Deltaproteobacteria bacterium]
MNIFKIGLIYLILVTLTYYWLFRHDGRKAAKAVKIGAKSLLNLLPLLLAVFALVGLFQEFLPPELIEKFFGTGHKLLSLMAGAMLGAVSIGPPLASYPIAGTMLAEGAWPPAVAAFILAWISVGVITLPFEAKIFGWRFALIRNSITLIAAMLMGLLLGGVL